MSKRLVPHVVEHDRFYGGHKPEEAAREVSRRGAGSHSCEPRFAHGGPVRVVQVRGELLLRLLQARTQAFAEVLLAA